MKNAFIHTAKITSTGYTFIERLNEFGERMTNFRITQNNNDAINPDKTGENIQESTIPTTPAGKYFPSSKFGSLYHVTQSAPFDAIAIPISPPMHECVVDTGISNLVAKSNHIPTAPTTQRFPYINIALSK